MNKWRDSSAHLPHLKQVKCRISTEQAKTYNTIKIVIEEDELSSGYSVSEVLMRKTQTVKHL